MEMRLRENIVGQEGAILSVAASKCLLLTKYYDRNNINISLFRTYCN